MVKKVTYLGSIYTSRNTIVKRNLDCNKNCLHIHDVFVFYVLDKVKIAYDSFDTPFFILPLKMRPSFTEVLVIPKPHITIFKKKTLKYMKSPSAKEEKIWISS